MARNGLGYLSFPYDFLNRYLMDTSLGLFYQKHLEETWDALNKLLRSGSRKKISVIGPTGSGRSLMLQQLREELGFVTVEPPPIDDPDAILNSLIQAVVASEHDKLHERSSNFLSDLLSERRVKERASMVVKQLATGNKSLAIRLPASWRLGSSVNDESPNRAERRNEAQTMINIMLDDENLIIILFAESSRDLPLPNPFIGSILKPMFLQPSQLSSLVDHFSLYRQQADSLSMWCSDCNVSVTPLQFRLGVGLLVLGVEHERIQRVFRERHFGLQPLENLLIDSLRAERNIRFTPYVLRMALERRPIPRGDVRKVTEFKDDQTEFFTECLAYGEDKISMHERVRDSVLQLFNINKFKQEYPAAHRVLASYHRQFDGKSSILKSSSKLDWLERVHHMANAGLSVEQEWRSLVLPCREFYLDRARALSLQGEFVASAEVYKACLDRFGKDDAYAQHYLGYNLDRAATNRAAAERAFREAIELDKDNPWWNGRLVTFLIDQARFLEARREWSNALSQVDPDGEWVRRDAWLAHHFHRWVVSAWLDSGEVDLAREAFDSIPRDMVENNEALSIIQERLFDAEEARALGESVYPAAMPLDERWREPRIVPSKSSSEAARRAWYPGRVIQGTPEGVVLVFAIPDSDPSARRTKVKEILKDDWIKFSGSPPEEAKGFVEIGSYEDGSLIIRPIDDHPPRWARRIDPDDELRYLRRWNATTES